VRDAKPVKESKALRDGKHMRVEYVTCSDSLSKELADDEREIDESRENATKGEWADL
jgi:hypothetical protein